MANAATTTTPTVHADEWDARTVAQFALYATRQPGSVATLVADLQAHSYRPSDNKRIWVLETSDGEIVAEEPSLYAAIHQIAK